MNDKHKALLRVMLVVMLVGLLTVAYVPMPSAALRTGVHYEMTRWAAEAYSNKGEDKQFTNDPISSSWWYQVDLVHHSWYPDDMKTYDPQVANGAEHEDTDMNAHGVDGNLWGHFWYADWGENEDHLGLSEANAWERAHTYWGMAVEEFDKGNTGTAYELVGHVAHLLQDVGTPSHASEHDHPCWGAPGAKIGCDHYEDDYMWWSSGGNANLYTHPADVQKLKDKGFIALPQGYDPLWYLFFTTDEMAQFFDSYGSGYPLGHRTGDLDGVDEAYKAIDPDAKQYADEFAAIMMGSNGLYAQYGMINGATGERTISKEADNFAGIHDTAYLYSVRAVGTLMKLFEDVTNDAPIANAGDDQTIHVGTQVTLDGSGSSDPNNDPLTYAWTLTSSPEGSGQSLSGEKPTFTPDKVGDYTFELKVTDEHGAQSTNTATVTITSANAAPIAKAGDDQTIHVGTQVTLDGSGSSDPDNDPITYAWKLVSAPGGDNPALSGADTAKPTFTPDKVGDYTFELKVTDKWGASATDQVTVTTKNNVPAANAGDDKTLALLVDTPFKLQATASDLDNDPLTYKWTVTEKPSDSTEKLLSDDTQLTPQFTPDRVGTYTLKLVVSDRWSSSAPDSVTFTVNPSTKSVNTAVKELKDSVNDATFDQKNKQDTYQGKIDTVQKMIDNKNYEGAIDKLKDDLLPKTDGKGNDDWITTGHEAVQDWLQELIDQLTWLQANPA